MADPQHLDILKQGVDAWNAWWRENKGIKPDLEEAGLAEADLRGADLTQVNLWEADLTQAILTETDLKGTDLTLASLIMADLTRANLTEADLSNVDLREANLRGAILTRADLTEAILRNADLTEANLRGVILTRTNLTWARLREADLTEAILRWADLRWANLNEADLSEATCGSTHFSDVDLSTVKGLETIRHKGPSYIDIHTLVRSQGKIPEVFLRGCGVPDDFITFIPSLVGKALDFYSCFISYSHEDKSFARRVHDTLQGRGIRCWLNEKEMLPGDSIYAEVDRGIRQWDKVLLCASAHSLTSWWVDSELHKAFEKERELMKARQQKVLALIPLDLDGYLFSDAFTGEKKLDIQSRLAANFNGWEHDNTIFEREIERVIQALRTDGGKALPPTPKL